jgi:hypothetical protein
VTDPTRAPVPSKPDTLAELEPLFELARSQLTDTEPRRHGASLEAVQRCVERAHRRQRQRNTWRAGAAAVLVASIVGWFALDFFRMPLDMEVVAGELSATGQVSTSSTTTTIRFSDGTQLAVDPAARAQVASVRANGADIRLERGKVRLQVTKRPGAHWNVLAGAYRVHVTGTSFAVALADDGEQLDVQLFSGSVRVSGPLIEGGMDVTPAKRLSIDSRRGLVRFEAVASLADATPTVTPPIPEAPLPSPAAPDASTANDADDTPVRSVSKKRPAKAQTAVPSWSSRVAAGEFDLVVSAAEARGLDKVYQRAPLVDLEALADAARYARRSSVARDALLAMRSRFAGSKPAKQAAFLLGRLVEDESAPAALEWYERYLKEDPDGVHASQALGRKMLILHRQGDAAATSTAQDYLRRFPSGSHGPSARRILTGN